MPVENDPNTNKRSDTEEYLFLREQIKRNKIGRNKFFRSFLKTIFFGVVFGIVACVSFFALMPIVEDFFVSNAPPPITIVPDDDIYEDEPNVSAQNPTENEQTTPNGGGGNITIITDENDPEQNGANEENGATEEPANGEDEISDDEPYNGDEGNNGEDDTVDQGNQGELVPPGHENIDDGNFNNPPLPPELPPELTAENYLQIMGSMYEIAQEANMSIVHLEVDTGQGIRADDEESRAARTSGLIIYDDGVSLSILASNVLVGAYQNFSAIMADGTIAPATLRMQDRTRGIAVFTIHRMNLEVETRMAIQVATLGNSSFARQGDIMIAVGNLLGHGEGIGYGILSSVQSRSALADVHFRILGTDVIANPNATGFLFNTRGNVMGLILPGPWQGSDSFNANALAISDLKTTIDLLLNGEVVPFFGIEGITVTEEIAEFQEIPIGVYVSNVEIDSPAMRAGIQNGDVITSINDTAIATMTGFTRAILGSNIDENTRVVVGRRGSDGYIEMDFNVIMVGRN